MSDTTISPFDAAIDALRERERQYDAEAQSLITRRDEVRETIALLTSRRPRAPRKPRSVPEVAGQAPDVTSPFAFVPAFAREPAEEVA